MAKAPTPIKPSNSDLLTGTVPGDKAGAVGRPEYVPPKGR